MPSTHWFMPQANCCLCTCKGGQCRVSDYGTGAVDCLWPSDTTPAGFNRPLQRGRVARGDMVYLAKQRCGDTVT